MDKFTRKTIPPVREAIEKALREVGSEYGLSFEVGKIGFFDTSLTAKIECVINNEENGDNSVAKHIWDKHCVIFALKPEDFGKTFESKGNIFEICGCKPNNTKYPILAKKSNGRVFKFNVASITFKLNR